MGYKGMGQDGRMVVLTSDKKGGKEWWMIMVMQLQKRM